MSDLLQSTGVVGGRYPAGRQRTLAHPDADQLNAFVERALPEHERLETLAHLAECAECREIVALSVPARELEAGPREEAEEEMPPGGEWTAGRNAGRFGGWRVVWVAGPALAALLLLTIYLRNVMSRPHLDARAGQVADARPPVPAPRSIAPAPAPVTPPADTPSAAKERLAQQAAPASAATPAAPAGPAGPAAQAHTLRTEAVPQPMVPERIIPNRALAGRSLQSRGLVTLGLRGSQVQAVQGAPVGGPVRKQAGGGHPAAPSSAPRTVSPEGSGVASGLAEQPAFSVREAIPAGSQAAAISRPATGGVAASHTVSAGFATMGASADAAAPVASADVSRRPEANVDAARNGEVHASGQAPLPSGLAVLSLAASQGERVALDAGNQLFVSGDEGQHWRRVSAAWKGRAIAVAKILPEGQGTGGTTGPAARLPAATLAVPERYTPGAAATVQSGQAGATLSGGITDATGAAIPVATVVATESRTGLTRTTRTDAQGHYLFDKLPPGVYRLEARAAGFAGQSQVADLGAAEQSVNNMRLAVGQSAATVTVKADSSAQLEPSSRTFGSLIGRIRRTAPHIAGKSASGKKPPLFLLTTDTGERWTSPDGIAWTRE